WIVEQVGGEALDHPPVTGAGAHANLLAPARRAVLDGALEALHDARAVVGVHDVEDVAADELGGHVAEDRLVRLVDEERRAVRVEQTDRIEALLDEHPVERVHRRLLCTCRRGLVSAHSPPLPHGGPITAKPGRGPTAGPAPETGRISGRAR